MVDSAVLQFAGIAVALVVSPGPTLAVVLRNALDAGPRGGVATALGIGCGNAVQALVAAAGFAAFLQRAPAFRSVLEVAGGAYLLWLGAQSARRAIAGRVGQVSPARSTATAHGFRDGLVTNLLHPAITIFYVTAVPAFIAPGTAPLPRFLMLAGIHVGFSTLWMSGCALVVGRAATLLTRPAVAQALHAASGAVLIVFGMLTIARAV